MIFKEVHKELMIINMRKSCHILLESVLPNCRRNALAGRTWRRIAVSFLFSCGWKFSRVGSTKLLVESPTKKDLMDNVAVYFLFFVESGARMVPPGCIQTCQNMFSIRAIVTLHFWWEVGRSLLGDVYKIVKIWLLFAFCFLKLFSICQNIEITFNDTSHHAQTNIDLSTN